MNWWEFLDDDIRDHYLMSPDKSTEALLVQLLREVKSLHNTMCDVAHDLEAIRVNTR